MAAQNLVNSKQDLIAALVQRELLETASLTPCATDLSSLAVAGAQSISVPKYSSFTVQDRSFGAAASENAALTDSVDKLDLDKNKIVLFGYDSNDDMQSTTDYMVEAIRRASSAHGRQINDDLITEMEAVAGLSVNGGAPADITAANILDMRQFLVQNFADMGRAKFVVAADQEAVMLALPEFSRYEYRGVSPAPVVNGMIGSVYGVPVILNQQLKAQQAFMIAPEGLGIAFQKAPSVAEDTDLRYGTGGKQVAVDVLYGVKGMLLGEGEALGGGALGATLSPHIAKLTD